MAYTVSTEDLCNFAKITEEYKKIKEIFLNSEVSFSVQGKVGLSDFQVCIKFTVNNFEFAQIFINQLAGNCGTAVINQVLTKSGYQNKGIGRLMVSLAERMAIHCKYSMAIATTVPETTSGIKILTKLGWTKIPNVQFRNQRTSNMVSFWYKSLLS